MKKSTSEFEIALVEGIDRKTNHVHHKVVLRLDDSDYNHPLTYQFHMMYETFGIATMLNSEEPDSHYIVVCKDCSIFGVEHDCDSATERLVHHVLDNHPYLVDHIFKHELHLS